ncbi:phenylacetate 2-hydroxylase [Paramyrothecium foliicola]|nr:phenylacetate 2-hydroxylase [Paramyrothecium foliicola]
MRSWGVAVISPLVGLYSGAGRLVRRRDPGFRLPCNNGALELDVDVAEWAVLTLLYLNMTYYIIYAACAAAFYFLVTLLLATDKPKIKNLAEIPGVPIFGNLIELGTDHARVAQRWAKKYGPVFQTRLGNRRVVFVNSFETVKYFWVTHQSALISRPMFHTFHSVVSSSQGLTIGTSPWDESCKNRRKAAATALNRPAVQSYMPILDLESTASIRELLEDCQGGSRDIDPNPHFARFALNTSLVLNYGFRLDAKVDGDLLKEITLVERAISNFRSTSNNWQDYVPMLRLWSKQDKSAEEFRLRRDKYLTALLDKLKKNITDGTDKPCISGHILKDPEAKLNEAELKSICLTMVSAGFDTVPGNIVMGLAYLSTKEGQAVQAKALEAIEEVYPDGDAWEKCLVEEKVPYITALVKETLRYWTIIPMCLPRTSIKDVPYKDAVIPAGTTFFMNAYAADYDEDRFKNPYAFIPERFLDDKDVGTPHYAYGAGSRMCAGSHLANRELFTTYIRLITAFEISPAQDPADHPIMDAIDCSINPTSLTTDPRPFKVGLRARSESTLRQWIEAAEERTRDL